MTQIGRPRSERHLPVVLTVDEIARILAFMDGEHRLLAQLLYGNRDADYRGASAFALKMWISSGERSSCGRGREKGSRGDAAAAAHPRAPGADPTREALCSDDQ